MNSTERSCLNSRDRKRLVSVFIFLSFLFTLLIVQYYKIQVVNGEKWKKHANAQHVLRVKEPYHRGVFYSNTSLKKGHPEYPQPLVTDVAKFHLFSDSTAIPEEYKGEVIRSLSSLLKSDRPQIEKIAADIFKKTRSRRLVTWLTEHEKAAIEKWWFPYASKRKIPRNALFFVKDYKRSYPFGKLLGPVIHTVREDRDEETNQSIPTGGLEMLFDPYLQGKDGERLLMRSPRHPMDTGKIIALPEDGADVYLTINHYIQAIAEQEIEKAVKASNAKGGWAVMMDPSTGEILALAQYPFFDPRDYTKYYNSPQLAEHTKVKAVTDAHEPGSVMKTLTLAIGLKAAHEMKKMGERPFFEPAQKIDVTNGNFPGRPRPLKDGKKYKFLNMYLAFQKSSNIYMAKLVQKVIGRFGEAWYRNELEKTFGLGLKTGIELPSESPGVLPRIGKTHSNGTLEWSTSTPYSLAIGHNVMANSIQMVRAISVIANGGYLVKPTIIRQVVKNHPNGFKEVLIDNTRDEIRKNFPKVLDADICKEVTKAMKYVTKPGGTAPKADVLGYTEAGKTGTSEKIMGGQYSKSHYFSSFVGFAPAENPRFVLLIGIDEPEVKYVPGIGKRYHGGTCAAPAFREIAFRTLQYLGVEPDDPYGYPVGDPRRAEEKADWHKETVSLKKLNDEWNN